MALINRVTRLFRADFNAVLDRIEEPEQLLKQAIRDMDDELAAAEQGIRACTHEQEVLAARRAELGEKLREVDEQLDLCFREGRDELARGLVRRKLETQRLLKRLDAKAAATAKSIAGQRARLDENRATLESLRQKAELFARRPAEEIGGDGDDIAWMARELKVSDEDIDVAFLREKAARGAS